MKTRLPCPPHSQRAFTLVELLTVVAIVTILAAILIPVVSSVRKSARNTGCLANLRRLGIDITLYAQDHKQTLPRVSIAQTDTSPASNWVFLLSGFLDKGTDYIGIRAGSSLTTVNSHRDSVLLCKQNVLSSGITSSSSASTYAMNTGCSNLVLIRAIHPAHTALMVESPPSGTSWSITASASSGMSASVHGNHSNVLYLDGHVGEVTAIPSATSPFWTP